MATTIQNFQRNCNFMGEDEILLDATSSNENKIAVNKFVNMEVFASIKSS